MRSIAILGSTGSIGRQCLEVVRLHKELFSIELLVANNNYQLLAQQAIEFDANAVVIANEEHYEKLKQLLENTNTKVFTSKSSICSLVESDNIDIVVSAMVGFSGFEPTISAIKAHKLIALANKETLVAGGELIINLAKEYSANIIPVDSEHSAIFQCLLGAANNKIEKIHLTASGGPFRNLTKEDIEKKTAAEALKHPNWNMGKKISIDSATMMNKGLELIEAKWLFDVEAKDIEIIVHPQSIIHSMVEFEDAAVLAQMGSPDMRGAIQFALCFPQRLHSDVKKLNFTELNKLEFFKADTDRFPCLALAYSAIETGGNIPCIMNAANEVAVYAYLDGKIGFYDINKVIEDVMNKSDFISELTIDNILDSNNTAIIRAKEIIKKFSK